MSSSSFSVPQGKIRRPSSAYFAYADESKKSHPSATARGKTRGCPAPKRCTGFEGSRPRFDARIQRTRSVYRWFSMRGRRRRSGRNLHSRRLVFVRIVPGVSGYTEPWTVQARSMSPFSGMLFFALRLFLLSRVQLLFLFAVAFRRYQGSFRCRCRCLVESVRSQGINCDITVDVALKCP